MTTIERVEVWPLRHELTEGYGGSRRFVTQRVSTLVRIHDSDGVSGWGEAFGPPPAVAAALAKMVPPLIGASVGVPGGASPMPNSLTQGGAAISGAAAALDIAFWDIRARAAGISVAEALGGRRRDRVPCYASTGNIPADRDNSRVITDVQSALQDGFRSVKIRIGCDPSDDEERVRLARGALGSHRLMVDINANYTAALARASIRRIAPYDIDWVEEPLPPEDLAGYRGLRELRHRPKIAAGEALSTAKDMLDLIQLVDVIQPDPTIVGVGGFRHIAQSTIGAANVAPHCWGGAVSQLISLQLLAWLAYDGPEEDLAFEWDRSENPLRTELFHEPQLVDGHVLIPEGPGLGLDIDETAATRFLIDGVAPEIYTRET